MELLHPHCAGLDVHKDSVVACIRHMVDGKVSDRGQDLPDHNPGTDGLVRLAIRSRRARISPWRRPASTGSRSGTFSPMASSSWSWPTPPTSRTCRGARPT